MSVIRRLRHRWFIWINFRPHWWQRENPGDPHWWQRRRKR
jgi:hypothetical protein